jgi:hypothetical protein
VITRITDVVVPERFAAYVRQLIVEKSALIRSGVMANDALLASLLSGGGLTFNLPSWRPLADDTENVSTDDPGVASTPENIDTSLEIGVRLSRNMSWGSADLTAALAGDDPMRAIGDQVSEYWIRRMQAAFIATWTGVTADNTANDAGDYTLNISGVGFIPGVTNFTAGAYIDAKQTMGDHSGDLSALAVHSLVYATMLKGQLIDFVSDATNPSAQSIPTFLGARVIVDDKLPRVGSICESWLFGPGATRFGNGSPAVPAETFRNPELGTGGGVDTLFSRVEWLMHPVGHAYVGTAPNGGPSNAATANNLAAAASWNRVFSDRKQIKFARLVTRES